MDMLACWAPLWAPLCGIGKGDLAGDKVERTHPLLGLPGHGLQETLGLPQAYTMGRAPCSPYSSLSSASMVL